MKDLAHTLQALWIIAMILGIISAGKFIKD